MAPRTLLLTGASSGIGRALALEYASRGAHVALAARRHDELEALARACDGRGGRGIALPVDVSDPDAVRAVVRRADDLLGGLDMVIANAGVGTTGHSATLQWDDVARVLDVNARGAIATLVAAIPIFLAQQRGHLVGVSSLAGRRALPESAAYSASKAALSTFLETLRIDLAPAGIHVTDVQPGFVDTAMIRDLHNPKPFLWTPERAARVIARRLERAPAVIAFPWPLAALTSIARSMPRWLYDPIVRTFAR